jgi:predicted nucleotidyltransferase
MNNIQQIKSKLSQLKKQLIAEFHIKEIGVFGSYVRNEQTNKSDLDVLVDFSEYPGMFQFVKMENFLSEQLGIKVDLVIKSALKPNIGKKILSEVEML